MSTRVEQKAATRATLRSAGQACFLARGFAATSVKHIVSEAAVAHGTFYVHFSNKTVLLDELLDEFNLSLAAKLGPILGEGTTPTVETVRQAAEVFLDHWHEHRRMVECFAERSAASLSLANLRDGLNPPMADLLERSLTAASHLMGSDVNVELVSHALLGLWLRVGLQYLFNEDVSRDQAATTLARMSAGALGAVLEL
jgi:AcrR family transcriptional regulator